MTGDRDSLAAIREHVTFLKGTKRHCCPVADVAFLLAELDRALAEAAHAQRELDLLRVMKAPPMPRFDTFGANHTDVTKWPYRKEADGGD